MPVALGLSVTLPGIPVVFAGDEFGLTGEDGEASRTPMPWGTTARPMSPRASTSTPRSSGCDARTSRSRRAACAGSTSATTCSSTCASRPTESVLCVAARADYDVALPSTALAGADAATPVFGDGRLAASVDGIA